VRKTKGEQEARIIVGEGAPLSYMYHIRVSDGDWGVKKGEKPQKKERRNENHKVRVWPFRCQQRSKKQQVRMA